MKHTPGPLHLKLDPETGEPIPYGDTYGLHYKVYRDGVEICRSLTLDQARLFAAAPDLLVELQQMVFWAQNIDRKNEPGSMFDSDLLSAQASIDKATK